MKPFPTFFLLFFSFTFAFAQTTAPILKTTQRLFDNGTQAWIDKSTTNYQYDLENREVFRKTQNANPTGVVLGYEVEKEYHRNGDVKYYKRINYEKNRPPFEEVVLQNVFQYQITFNDNDQPIRYIQESETINDRTYFSPKTGMVRDYTYTEFGCLKEEVMQFFDNERNQWTYGYKREYTNTAKCEVMEQIFYVWLNNQWKAADKAEFLYTEGKPWKEFYYIKGSNGWTLNNTNVYVYNSNGDLMEKNVTYSDNVQYTNTYYTYDSENRLLEELTETRLVATDKRLNFQENVFVYNNSGLKIKRETNQMWLTEDSSEWHTKHHITYTYDSDNYLITRQFVDETIMISPANDSTVLAATDYEEHFTNRCDGEPTKIIIRYNDWNGQGTPDDMEVLHDYYFAANCENKSTPTIDEIDVYPNPSNDIVNVQSPLFYEGDGRVVVVDASGKMVEDVTVLRIADRYRIEVSKLETGIYFVKAVKGDMSFIKPFMVME